MVLFVSGRTDILSYYPKWFINRVKEGFIDTRNPYNDSLVSRIFFDLVDIIMFCTKNPHPFLKYLDELDKLLPNVPLVFHITLTPYHNDIEPVIGKIKKQVIEDIKYLAKRYGKENIFIRYDPILKNEKYTIDYHIKAFKKVVEELDGYSENIVISFIDLYKNTLKNNDKYLHIQSFTSEDYEKIGINFSRLAKEHGFKVFTCGEKNNLLEYGFDKGSCLTKELATKLLNKVGKSAKFKKQTNRKDNSTCECIQTVDIGAYNSCKSFCRYCYANFDENKDKENCLLHSDDSSLLVGEIKSGDVIKERIE